MMDSFQRLWTNSNKANHDRWKIIALSILAATTFWFFNALNKSDYTATINYPIELIYPEKDSLLIVGELPRVLRINVTGGGWNLIRGSMSMGTEPLQVEINAPTDQKYLLGASLAPLINDQITTFRLNSVITDSLHFHIERKSRRQLKVVLDEVNLAEDFVLTGEIQLRPDSIAVSGPLSFINELPDSLVIKLNDNLISEDYSDDIDINLQKEQVSSEPTSVNVSFNVEQLLVQERYVQITDRNFPQGYTTEADSSGYLVSYKVSPSYVDSVGPTTIQVYADLDEMKLDSTIRLKTLSNSRHIYELEMDPVIVRIISKKKN